MRTQLVLGVVIGVFAGGGLPCPAQERTTLPELVPPPKKEPLPGVALEAAPCATDCALKPSSKVLWVEREVPIQVLRGREVVTTVPTTTFEVAYREKKHTVTEMVLEPRVVERPVVSATVKPVTVTDPCTGKCSTVMQPCTEVKMVKQTEFVAVPKEKVLIERVPYLKTVEIQVPQKTVIFEYHTEMKKVGGPVRVPAGNEVLPDRMLLAPKPPCPQ